MEDFKNIVSEANVDKRKFKHAQMKLYWDPYSIECQQIESQLYHQFRTSSYLAESFIQQISKETWIRLGGWWLWDFGSFWEWFS